MDKKIEIYIACHKPSEIPPNKLFIPIHVGAAKSNIVMEGMLRDDTGDNISEKNPNYCELTAQYWAWKNSNADYIGLCHYRRYLSFASEHFTNLDTEHRGQVQAKILNPETERKYGLLDEEAMREIILANDVLVCNSQDLTQVVTPFEIKFPVDSSLEHWQALDGICITVEDLDKMFRIVERDYPEFYTDMMEYMKGKFFYGYNTFVFRRDLFDELCEIEFDILEKLEREVDISNYNVMLSRIYGFMGEIIFSSYIYHIKKRRGNIKVGERQIIYFQKTDPIKVMKPESGESLKIVVDLDSMPTFFLQPFLSTFLRICNKNIEYELIIIGDYLNPQITTIFENFVKPYDNIRTKFLNINYLFSSIEEMYGIIINIASIFLPWILSNYDKCLYLKWNTIIEGDLAELYGQDLNHFQVMAAKDIYIQSILNNCHRVKNREAKKFYQDNLDIKNIFLIANDTVILMDLKEMRRISFEDAVKKVVDIKKKAAQGLNSSQLFNAFFYGKMSYLPQQYNHFVSSNSEIKFYIAEAPLPLLNEYRQAIGKAIVRSYEPNALWYLDEDTDIKFFKDYWQTINESGFTQIFQTHFQNYCPIRFQNINHSMVHRIFEKIIPKGSPRYETLKKLMVKNSFVYKTAKTFYNKFVR